MNCNQTNNTIQDWLDGDLTGIACEQFREHLAQCPRCRAASQDWRALQQALRNLPAPEPSVDLECLLQTSRSHRPNRLLPTMAAAASLVIGVAVLSLLTSTPKQTAQQPQIATIQLPLNTSETVELSLASATDLNQVRLTLLLPRNLELEGFPKQQVISWKTNLRAGNNRLSLPLNARVLGDGVLVAKIEHGNKSKEVRVHISTQSAPSSQSRRRATQPFTLAHMQLSARRHQDV